MFVYFYTTIDRLSSVTLRRALYVIEPLIFGFTAELRFDLIELCLHCENITSRL